MIANLSFVTCCWGDYWDKYGQRWIKTVQALDPQPSEIIVAVDRPVDLPDGWKYRVAKQPYFFEGWMDVWEAAENDYVAFLSMDDLMPTDGLADLVLEGDIIVSGLVHSDGTESVPTKEKYDNIFNEDWYPLVGYIIMRKDVLQKVRWRPITWQDWIAALEFKHLNLDVRFDPRIRYIYSMHKNQHSRRNTADGYAAVKLMKELLPTGRVIHDASWPPRLK